MSFRIPESDWRKFKKTHQALLERFYDQILAELRSTLDGPGSSHERYLAIWKQLKKRDEDLGRAFDDYRRSTAMQQLAIMRGMGLLSDEDLAQFSDETRDYVARAMSVFESQRSE